MTATAPGNLWEAFESAALLHPAATALFLPDHPVTFETLRQDVAACAGWLDGKGVRAGNVVAIQLPKRRETYTLWLACLRQGAVYVFVDPQNPPERTQRILERTKPALLATGGDARNPFGLTEVIADQENLFWTAASASVAPAPLHGLSPAYIMFTSGSTGEPKGAVIPHQGVLSLMRWVRSWCPDPAARRFSNLNPLHFDNSVFDLYGGLLNGAGLVPVETSKLPNPLAWVRRLRDHAASVVFAVPTLFLTMERLRLLTPQSLPSVRTFVFGGEGFPISILRQFYSAFHGSARLLNVYGPTETSCICSSIEINPDMLNAAGTGFASLGRMHPDFEHAVLDEDGAPCATGEPGELWIGGANVGLGYYSNPAETGRRFVQDPRQSNFRSIWYRSGDLVREDADGLLWFQGRVDNQVKVRGHRIELEEIDLALEAVAGVTRAVAVVAEGKEGPEIRVAFTAATTIEHESLRSHCQRRLPKYMQPAHFVQVESLPQNANGKVDRRATVSLLSKP